MGERKREGKGRKINGRILNTFRMRNEKKLKFFYFYEL